MGGDDRPIAVINRGKERSEAELFCNHFKVKYGDIRAGQNAGDNVECVRAVAAVPGGIAYISVGEAERAAKGEAALRLLPIDGVQASSLTVRRGDFPLSRPLTLVTRELPTGLAKAFINFALSSEATQSIEELSFVPYLD